MNILREVILHWLDLYQQEKKMIRLKQQIKLFIIPSRNYWWTLKLTGKKRLTPAQLQSAFKTKKQLINNF